MELGKDVVTVEVEGDDAVGVDEIELDDADKVELDDAVKVELALVELPVSGAAVDAIKNLVNYLRILSREYY